MGQDLFIDNEKGTRITSKNIGLMSLLLTLNKYLHTDTDYIRKAKMATSFVPYIIVKTRCAELRAIVYNKLCL